MRQQGWNTYTRSVPHPPVQQLPEFQKIEIDLTKFLIFLMDRRRRTTTSAAGKKWDLKKKKGIRADELAILSDSSSFALINDLFAYLIFSDYWSRNQGKYFSILTFLIRKNGGNDIKNVLLWQTKFWKSCNY